MKRLAAAALMMAPAVAWAQDEPRFCPNSPSLESSACTTEPGRVHVEATLGDWQLERNANQRIDTVLAGDVLVRAGVGPSTEVQLEWTPYGHVRTRDRATGLVEKQARVGDVTLGVRQNLRNPDGKGLSFGIQPSVTLPVGRSPVGAGDWAAGVVLPVTYDLTDTINIGTTGELDAAVDEDGHGRHFQGSMVAAVAIEISDAFSTTIEAQVMRDDDPSGATTQAVAGLGCLWTVAPRRAFFAEAVGGLNHAAPDVRLYAGIAALF